MARWATLDAGFLLYWASRCEAVLEEDQKRMDGKKKLTKGDVAGVDSQTKILAAIRRELTRRQGCP